jgi:hypothetical protein
MKKDILIADHIDMISNSSVSPRLIEHFTTMIMSIQKNHIKKERRKRKIKSLYG